MSRFDLSLYLVTDPSAAHGVVETAKAAAANGATMVQLRDKHADDDALIEQAKALKEALAPFNVPLIINDRLDVAVAADAEGVHLGQSDGSLEVARKTLGPRGIIGLSIDQPSQLDPQLSFFVDYFGIGPVFATDTKAEHAPPIGFDGLARIIAQTEKACVAIGGLKPGHLGAVRRAGADGAAVVSAICGADDPGAMTKQMRTEWEGAAP